MRLPFLLLLATLSAQAWSHGYTPSQSCNSEKFNYIQLYQVDASDVHFAPLKHFYINQSSNIIVCLDDDAHNSDYGTGQCRHKCKDMWSKTLESKPLSSSDFGLPDGVTISNMYFAPACKGVFATTKSNN